MSDAVFEEVIFLPPHGAHGLLVPASEEEDQKKKNQAVTCGFELGSGASVGLTCL